MQKFTGSKRQVGCPESDSRASVEPWEPGWKEFRYGKGGTPYPRHEAWPKAEKAYKALWKAGKLPAKEVISVAIRCQQRPGGCLQRVVTKDGRDTRPYPASWLNAERWHDELEPPFRETAAAAMGMPEGERRTPESIDQEAKERALEWHRNQEMEREHAKAEFFRLSKKPPA